MLQAKDIHKIAMKEVGDHLAQEGFELTIDLPAQSIFLAGGEVIKFEVDAFRKHCLINGLDDIGLTLQDADAIKAYEQTRRAESPWLFN